MFRRIAFLAILSLGILTSYANAAPQSASNQSGGKPDQFDMRKARAEAMLETGTDMAKLVEEAKRNSNFQRGEKLYKAALEDLENKGREAFNNDSFDAIKAYMAAANDGSVLAAAYAEILNQDWYVNTSHTREWSIANGISLANAGHCTGWLYQANSYDKLGEYEKLLEVATEGLERCSPETSPNWAIRFLKIHKAQAKTVLAEREKRRK